MSTDIQHSIHTNHTHQLPQMKSIWLDEDQEAEKLYGIQAQQLMGGTTGSDDEDELNITLINSDKPALNNKKKIDLRPLTTKTTTNNNNNNKSTTKSTSKPNSNSNSKKSFMKKLFGGSSSSNSSKSNAGKIKNNNNNSQNRSISAPFDFQHISHAGNDNKKASDDIESNKELRIVNKTPLLENNSKNSNDNKSNIDNETHTIDSNDITNGNIEKETSAKETISMNKAFMTEATTSDESRPLSYTSSVYSSIHSKNDRIMSISTSATTFLERTPSFNKIKHISTTNNNNKQYLKHKYTNSQSSELSLDFLKNYSFPTLLENEQMADFNETKNASINSITEDHEVENCPDDGEINSSNNNDSETDETSARNSMTQSLSTPQLEEFLFSDIQFKDKISVDDILRYYHTSNAEVPSPYL